MKKNSTEFTFATKSGMFKLLVASLFVIFSSSLLQAQQAGIQDQIGDLSEQVWKSGADIDITAQEEIARMDAAIADGNTPDPDRALFTAYKRLVGYIQLGVQGGKPVGEALFESYDKVIAESATDPDMKSMPEGALINLVPTLVESLIAVPVPVQFQGQ